MRLSNVLLAFIPISSALPHSFTYLPPNQQPIADTLAISSDATPHSAPAPLFSIYNFKAQVTSNASSTTHPSWASFFIQDAAAKYQCTTNSNTSAFPAQYTPCRAYTNETNDRFSFRIGDNFEYIAVGKEWVVAGMSFRGFAQQNTNWEEDVNATIIRDVSMLSRAEPWGFEMTSVWMKVR